MGNRRGLASGMFCLWLASAFGCDTLSEPGRDPSSDIVFSGGVGGVGVGGSTFAGTAGVAGSAATGGTTIPIFCPNVDGDGDGYTVAGPGCAAAPAEGRDCDDLDPSVQVAAFVDSDADGAGDPASPTCIAASLSTMVGYASRGDDCNDVNPDVGPRMLDVFGDGLDRDCNGDEGSVNCALQTWCPCNANLATSVDTSNGCDGFDLAVLEVVACSAGCADSSAYVRIANVGKRAATGLISVLGPDGLAHPILNGLDPGFITAPFPWPGFTTPSLRVSSSEPGDCDPTNDLYEVPPGGLEPQCPK